MMAELALMEENRELKRTLARLQVNLNYAQACANRDAIPSSRRYQVMQTLHTQQHLPLTQLSSAAGVSRQAYYQWQHRRPSANDELNARLLAKIKLLERANHYQLGACGLATQLSADPEVGRPINPKRTRRLMRIAGIRVRTQHHLEGAPTSQQRQYTCANVLNRQFNVERANQVWCTDFTPLRYGARGEHQVYLTVVLDLCGNYVLSSNLSVTMSSNAAIQVVRRALRIVEDDVQPLLHTDRGPAYTSSRFSEYVAGAGMRRSMSAPGSPQDNAVIEHWWHMFKDEWIDVNPMPATLQELRDLVNQGIALFNYERRQPKWQGATPYEWYALRSERAFVR
jgi:transposase InsO family protein